MVPGDLPVVAAESVSVGFSDRMLLVASAVGFVALAVTVYSILWTRLPTADGANDDGATTAADYEERLVRANVATLNRAQRRARAKAIMKEQRRAVVIVAPADEPHAEGREPVAAAAAVEDGSDHDDDNDDDDDDDNDEVHPQQAAAENPHRLRRRRRPPGAALLVLSRKERQTAAKAAEREERRLYQAEREQQQKEALSVAQQQKKDRLATEAVKHQHEKKIHEAEVKARLEQERSAWLTFFTSSEAASVPRTQFVQEFITDCRKDRNVYIDRIATSFGVSPTQVLDRLDQLLHEGRIAGFFQDDRNRFVYISDDELSAIATAVKDHPLSVSLKDIAGICQTVIDE